MKKKGIEILGIIILVILVIMIIYVGRNMFIISKLSNNAEKTIENDNYHIIAYSYNLGDYTKEETFQLGDKKKKIITQVVGNSIETTTMFANKIVSNNDTYDTYLVNIYGETEEGKKAKLNQQIGLGKDLKNNFYTKNWWDLLTSSALTSIKTTKFNGNECYYIFNFKGTYSDSQDGSYINKDIGLPISMMGYEYKVTDENENSKARSPIVEYVYEFDVVTEEDFIEPNISEYEVQE